MTKHPIDMPHNPGVAPPPDCLSNDFARCISVIIPTYNRSYCLKKTLESYARADNVSELVVIDDGSTDDTLEILDKLSIELTNQCHIRVIKHGKRQGALRAKEAGAKVSSCPYILFGEDDVIIEPDYPKRLLKKIAATDCSYASGRIIYLNDHESTEDAKNRFGFGNSNLPYMDKRRMSFNLHAHITEDIEIPFSHALYMTKRDTALEIGYDTHYSIGTGYREETDCQLQGYFSGHKHILVHDVFCFHLPFSYAHRGGQRTNCISHTYYNIKLNNYFLQKNHAQLRKTLLTEHGKYAMMLSNARDQIYNLIIRKLINNIRHKTIKLLRHVQGIL